jgi:selenocysteine lyase/cysteine desulfurase
MLLNIDHVRSQFPSLVSGYIFADNAGGSQVISNVVNKISDYLTNTNVQPGAHYTVSQTSTQRVADGVIAAQELFNARSANEVVFGPSSTQRVENLARAMESDIKEGDEFIITGEHESVFLYISPFLLLTVDISKRWAMEEFGSSKRRSNQILER